MEARSRLAPALDTELTFRLAEDRMAKQDWTQAIGMLKTVIGRSPNEADSMLSRRS